MIDSAGLPIMIVSFSIEAAQNAEFTRFYHHQFLPKLLSVAPEIKNISRYQADSPANATTVAGQYLTIYELASAETFKHTDEIFERTGFAEEMKIFQQWKADALKDFSRTNYQLLYEHSRRANNSHFGRCPMLFFSSEVKAKSADAFRQWYQLSYLPRLMADVPLLSGCRRYSTSVVKAAEADGAAAAIAYITVMEAVDELTLSHSIERMSEGHRSKENEEIQKWLDSDVTFTATNTFRPIFCLPE